MMDHHDAGWIIMMDDHAAWRIIMMPYGKEKSDALMMNAAGPERRRMHGKYWCLPVKRPEARAKPGLSPALSQAATVTNLICS